MKSIKWAGTMALAAVAAGCSGSASPEGSELGVVGETEEALASTGFTPWTQVPAIGGGNFFKGRPALTTYYTDANNRGWSLCGAAWNNNVYCTYRFIAGGGDSGWASWSLVTPPAGVTLGASQPALATFSVNGTTIGAMAARESGWNCPNCINIQINQHGVSTTWYKIPGSGLNDWGFTGDISLVSSGGYLYAFGMVGNTTYNAWYTRNFVQNGYNNNGWEAWQPVPGGGVFNHAVTASAFGFGGVMVTGVGTDKHAYMQKFWGSWDGWWQSVGGAGVFKDTISNTNFSGIGDDVELFGLGTDNAEWEGDLNAAHTFFDGWYPVSNTTFLSSPSAFSPLSGHVDLAAWGNTNNIYIASYNKPATCADGSAEQTFSSGAVGCAGKVSWANRGSLCGAGARVCSAAEWVAARGSTVPTHNYWTNDNLLYSGSGTGNCTVSTTTGNQCSAGTPMRICTAAGGDAEGNACNWQKCGLNSASPIQYFGGCNGNSTAGTACCSQ